MKKLTVISLIAFVKSEEKQGFFTKKWVMKNFDCTQYRYSNDDL